MGRLHRLGDAGRLRRVSAVFRRADQQHRHGDGSLRPPADVVIALSTGDSGTYSSRRMSNGGAHLNYQLYSNAARTTVWGNGTGGTVAVSAHVTGSQNFTVFGQIPALRGVTPGAYVDTITVTVTF